MSSRFATECNRRATSHRRSIPGEIFAGKNVPFVAHSIGETAARFSTSEADTRAAISTRRVGSWARRDVRGRGPRATTKCSWPGTAWMISAFARGAEVFDEPTYLRAASSARRSFVADVQRHHQPPEAPTRRRARAGIDAVLEDYAFLIQGLLDLYEASFDTKWIAWTWAGAPGPAVLGRQGRRLFLDARERGASADTGSRTTTTARSPRRTRSPR